MVDEDDDRQHRAVLLVNLGLQAQEQGDLERAIELYNESLDLCPTAEGHTFLGWALSYADKLDEAIEHCREAIAIDPEFGNPYNDIGVYLMRRNQLDAAIPWLESAKKARRYQPRHFPYLNLGHIYAARGELKRAIEEFEGALRLTPEDAQIEEILRQLRAGLN